jgi:serine/threonine protein kinase/tetratricopeptide (TPR) repeat protein
MTPERWQQVEELFHSALAREPGQWATFLAQACADDESLFKEVESLISFHDQTNSFIEIPAFDLAAELLAKRPSELEVGQQVAHYKVLAPLGAGGMGEVYLAEDTRLGRRIALKLLPAQFTTDAERVRRFEQEARAASALNHPNIVTIHEIGRAESTHFIATEFIDGETLRVHNAGRAVNLNEALDIATQVASALEAAHAAGIVHRDIKPENVMLRRDRIVKVLDFGLAKLALPQLSSVNPTAQTRSMVITNPGILMGTVQYMSPEQARGQEVDARTDIWSLGVMLHEMVTGRVPFEGETPSHVIVSLLESEPPPLATHSEAPVELERIVTKALRKDREERYQTASEMALDLKSLKQELEVEARLNRSLQPDTVSGRITTKSDSAAAVETVSAAATGDVAPARTTSSAEYLVGEIQRHGRIAVFSAAVFVAVAAIAYSFYPRTYPTSGGEAIDSVAVLPFVNVTADPNTEYLSDGISDSVITSLSRLPKLGVISFSKALGYKGKPMDPQAIGRELNVKAVLMGRLTQQGDGLAISTELVDVRDNRLLWREQYNRKLSEILIVQDDIARQISAGLRLRLSGEEKKQMAKQYTENTEAYQLYILGRHYFNKQTKQAFEQSIGYYDQAIEKDPNYALAYTGLAYSYYSLGDRGFWTSEESDQKLERAALKARELDDTLAEGHVFLGVSKYNNFDWAGAEKELTQALELDPNSYLANSQYFRYLSNVGRPDEALSYAIRAQEFDAASVPGQVAYAYFLARQYDKAIELYREVLEKKPNNAQTHILLGETYAAKRIYKEGVAEIQKGVELDNVPERWDRHPMLAYAYAMAGRRDEALKILNEQNRLAKQLYISPYNFAIIYTGLGDKDKAFEWLEKGYEQHTRLIYRLKSRPMFDSLRSDPRYADLLRKMNLAP